MQILACLQKPGHGPPVESLPGAISEWSYLKAGKLRHRTLTPEQAEIMRLAIANNRKAKKLLRTWEVQTLHLIELKAQE